MTPENEPSAGQSKSRARKPRIRLNSAKVEQVDGSTDNLVDISENSRFAQWRRHQNERAEQEPVEDGGAEPIVLRPTQPAPGLWQRWKRWVYGAGVLALVAAVFVVVVFFSPLLATRTITVEGASLLDSSYVQDQLAPLEAVPMTRVTEAQVAELIGNEQVLYGVSIEANPPHELVVKLHERVPVAVVEDGDSYLLVDNEGKQLGNAVSVEDAGVPLVAGGTDILGTNEFSTVTGVLAALPTSILSQVSEAKADSASTITLEMVDGTKVVWGTPDESELKANVLARLMESVGADGSVTTYDVSSPLVPTVE